MKLRFAAGLVALTMSLGGGSVWADETTSSSISSATTAQLEQIKKRFETEFEGIEVEQASSTPFDGIIELRLPGNDIIYTNANLDFIFQGALIDVASRTDLTAQRIEEINRIDFTELPLDKAIKTVKGDGAQQIAIFEDPNCIYCKRLHETLNDIDNVTVYTLLFPILTPESRTISEHVWCSEDRSAAWNAWMQEGKKPAEKTCETPIDDLLQLGLEQGVQGTPAIFFEDGSRANGWLPADKLKERLEAASTALTN